MGRLKGHWLLIAAGSCILVVVVGMALNIYFLIHTNTHTPNPLRYSNPQQIVDPQDFYHPGDTIKTLGTKCNVSKTAVRVQGTSAYEKTTAGSTENVQSFGGNRILDPGCLTRVFTMALPSTLTTGTWRLTGHDCTVSGNQCADWYTEIFRVTGR